VTAGERSPVAYQYSVPPPRDDGWPVGTMESVGISRESIEKLVNHIIEMPMDSLNTSDIHAVLIARHGKLVLEEYFHGFSRDRLHDTRSAAKSYTSTLAGAALAQKCRASPWTHLSIK